MSRFLGIAVLAAAVLASPAARAEGQRYYDAEHKDFHQWDAKEQQAYRRFLEETHRKYHDWSKASSRERQEYWHWRHNHPG